MSSTGFPIGYNFTSLLGNRFGGLRLDPYQGFNFLVEIEGLLVGGFTQVGGLESEVTLEEHQEGGVNDFVRKFPRETTSANLTLTHGLTDVSTLWNWYYNVTQGIIARKNGTIMLLDRQQFPVMYWNFRNAIPVKWSGPSFDASSSNAAVESVELIHEGLSKPLLGQLAAAGRGVAQLAGWQG